MICTPAIKATIRDAKIHQIYGLMQAGQKYGMQTLNQSLYAAVVNRLITSDEAMSRSADVHELGTMLGASANTF
jgi:twitching motility protein PilT